MLSHHCLAAALRLSWCRLAAIKKARQGRTTALADEELIFDGAALPAAVLHANRRLPH